MSSGPLPARAEVWWCELPEVGRRPVVVLSRDAAIPRLRRALVAPCTTTVRGLASGRPRARRRSSSPPILDQPRFRRERVRRCPRRAPWTTQRRPHARGVRGARRGRRMPGRSSVSRGAEIVWGTSRRDRVALAAVATIPLASTWLSTHASSAVAGGQPFCDPFKGKSLLRSRTLRVIARTRGERREYAFICVPPRGRVRLAGWAFDEIVGANYLVKVLTSAGSWAAIEFASQVDFHGGEAVGKTCNARSGRCYPFSRRSLMAARNSKKRPPHSPHSKRLPSS